MEPALQYLKRTLERPSTSFRFKPAAIKVSLLQLETTLQTCEPIIRTLIFKDWVTANLTDEGRVKMLDAVRQQRAAAKKRTVTHHSLRLPINTITELERLAKAVGGMPLTRLLTTFAAMGNADQALRTKLLKVGIAIHMK